MNQKTLLSTLLLPLAAAAIGCGDANPSADSMAIEIECLAPDAATPDDAVTLYLAGQHSQDSEERPCLIQRSLASEVTWFAINGPAEGRAVVRELLEEDAAQLAANDAQRELVGAVRFRHEEALLTWIVTDNLGHALESGEDWLEFSPGGRLIAIHRLTGSGTDVERPAELDAWERAWNTRDETLRRDELATATSEDIRFTDLLTDVEGRPALATEITRQQGLLNAQLVLGNDLRLHSGTAERPVLTRQLIEVALPDGATVQIINFVRFGDDGQIERVSGFPRQSP